MAKIKVHELAKELDIQSKELISFLQGKGIDVKAAQSSLEDEAVALAKKYFKEPAKGREEQKSMAKSGEAPKKKKKIITVDLEIFH